MSGDQASVNQTVQYTGKQTGEGSVVGTKKSLSETRRPGLISTMRSYLSQSGHRDKEEDTLRDILFLGLKSGHLCPKNRILNG
jgi:hypothetical protein